MGHFGYPAVQRSRERSERQDEQGLARGSFSKNASAASVFAELVLMRINFAFATEFGMKSESYAII